MTAARNELDAAASARDTLPEKLPANVIDPEAEVALMRTGPRRAHPGAQAQPVPRRGGPCPGR